MEVNDLLNSRIPWMDGLAWEFLDQLGNFWNTILGIPEK